MMETCVDRCAYNTLNSLLLCSFYLYISQQRQRQPWPILSFMFIAIGHFESCDDDDDDQSKPSDGN